MDQQLYRWLLLSLDRLPSNERPWRRSGLLTCLGCVAKATRKQPASCKATPLIHYSRGRIIVIDRPRTEARACECYHVVKREFDRLLPYAIAS